MSKERNEEICENGINPTFPNILSFLRCPINFSQNPRQHQVESSNRGKPGGNPVKIPASTRREKRRAGGKYRYKWTRGNRLSSRTTIMTVTRRYTPITQRGGKNGLTLNPPSFTPQWFSSTAISIVCFVNWTFESDSNAIIFEFAFPSFFFLIIFKREDKRRGTIFYD